MKIKKLTSEEFKGQTKLTKANKHLLGITNSSKRDELLFDRFKNADDYEKGADELANKQLSNNILGFISEKYYIKYDKINNELVMYFPDNDMKSGNQILSYFKPSRGLDYYNDLKQDHFISEIS